MKTLLIVLFFLWVTIAQAATIYVDKVGVDSTFTDECVSCSTPSDNDYDPETRDCGSGSETVYNSIQAAVTAMSGGDDIYIRNGTWEEYDIDLPVSKNGTIENYSSIQSYAGEWAILDGSASPLDAIIRHPTTNNKDQTDVNAYWKIERLEFTGNKFGILLGHGPITVRYCYFHNCTASVTGDEPMAALWINEAQECIIEYNYFYDSYDSDLVSSNDGLIGFLADYHEESGDGAEGEEYVEALSIRGNIIRYNYLNGNGHGNTGIHYKGDQRFGYNSRNPATVRTTYPDNGDEIHHNIIVNMGGTFDVSISSSQDNIWIHNNICSGLISAAGWQHEPPTYNQVVNNNTLIGDHASINISSGVDTDAPSVQNNYYDAGAAGDPDNGYDHTVTPNAWLYNNIISANIGTFAYDEPINIAHWMVDDWGSLSGESYTLDMSKLVATNNLFNLCPNDTFRVGTCDNEVTPETCGDGELDDSQQTNAQFNSHSAIWRGVGSVVNYDVDTANLFLGESGANQYITDGDYIVDGGSGTISDSGVSGNHPFRTSGTIPSYIGATDPDDNSWVAGVLSLATYTNLRDATPDSDPSWIEGSESEVTPNLTGLKSMTGGTLQ